MERNIHPTIYRLGLKLDTCEYRIVKDFRVTEVYSNTQDPWNLSTITLAANMSNGYPMVFRIRDEGTQSERWDAIALTIDEVGYLSTFLSLPALISGNRSLLDE